MSEISLQFVRSNFDQNAIFIVSKSYNNNVVVYTATETGSVQPYWLNLDTGFEDRRTESLNAVENAAFGLTWVSETEAYVQKVGQDRMITFDVNNRTCWTLINGESHYLHKIHIVTGTSKWLKIPSVTHIEVHAQQPEVVEIVKPTAAHLAQLAELPFSFKSGA